jgi:UPF0755 protein
METATMAGYKTSDYSRRGSARWLAVCAALAILIAIVAAGVVLLYKSSLGPVSSSTEQKVVVIASNTSVSNIATELKSQGLIRQTWVFERYIRTTGLSTRLQAGTYKFSPSQSTPTIARAMAEGKVAVDLVTIVPGSRLDQVRETLIKAKFDPAAVDAALDPSRYAANYGGQPLLAELPPGASLEGFLYPDSYQKDAVTDPVAIISQSLGEMSDKLTPDLRAAFSSHNLNVYQAVTLASIVEQEVSKQSDRAQAAQVFLKRLSINMPLGSDVTAFYGAIAAGREPSTTYDSPYNTLLYKGLPPGPISAVSASSLEAVAHPAGTDWLYFVAGDDGNTYFSHTNAEHEALTRQYCHKLCGQ